MLIKKILNAKFLLLIALSAALLLQSGNAFAWHRPLREIRHPHHDNRSIAYPPDNYMIIEIGGMKFYYRDGAFYRKDANRYIAANPRWGDCYYRDRRSSSHSHNHR